MLMCLIMFFTWQISGNGMYQGPFQRSVEAVYAGSELRQTVEALNDRIRAEYPLPTKVLPIGYAFFIKKQATFTSRRLSLIPGSVTTYNYDHNYKSGTISITWAF